MPYMPYDRTKESTQATFMSKVYGWMAMALGVTGLVAVYVASTPSITEVIFSSVWTFVGLIILEVALVMYLIYSIEKLSVDNALLLFFLYAAINGLTMSVVLLVYTAESVASTFFITGATFGIMSLYGYFTKKDLSSWGNILFMGVVGLIIAGIANMFIGSSTLGYIISFVGVLVFVGLTAYDTQKIKNMSHTNDLRAAILGALTLYLDFVNLFLYLLRFMGNKK